MKKSKTKTFEIRPQMKIDVKQQDIDDIMAAALEGGINYWCYKAEVIGDYLGEYASDQISRGGKLKLYDMEGGEKYWLDRDKLLNGLKLFFEQGYDQNGALDSGTIDAAQIGANDADAIIQLALFGEVLYC